MGKHNRGRFKCISVPPKSADASAPAASAASSAPSAPQVDPQTGLVEADWIGAGWARSGMGYTKTGPQMTFEEIKAKFPGISDDDAQRQLFPGADAAPSADAAMMDLELEAAASAAAGAKPAAPKAPVTSLSRRTPAKSRTVSRVGSPALGAAASPGAASPAAMSDAMTIPASVAATPSRVGAAGATWKSPATNPLSAPTRALSSAPNSAIKSKTLRKSWNDKRRLRDAAAEAKALQARISEAAAEERREAARRAAQKAAYKKEQELKNQKVQVITDTRKIKKMSRKQLRQVQKMDTGNIGKDVKNVTSRLLSRGIGHKIGQN